MSSSSIASFALVALGGGLGACLRYAALLTSADRAGAFPLTIFAVNILGSALLGLAAALIAEGAAAPRGARELLMIGLFGGFTTFSSYALDIVGLLERGRPGLATAYAAGSVAFSVLAAAGGLALGRWLRTALA